MKTYSIYGFTKEVTTRGNTIKVIRALKLGLFELDFENGDTIEEGLSYEQAFDLWNRLYRYNEIWGNEQITSINHFELIEDELDEDGDVIDSEIIDSSCNHGVLENFEIDLITDDELYLKNKNGACCFQLSSDEEIEEIMYDINYKLDFAAPDEMLNQIKEYLLENYKYIANEED